MRADLVYSKQNKRNNSYIVFYCIDRLASLALYDLVVEKNIIIIFSIHLLGCDALLLQLLSTEGAIWVRFGLRFYPNELGDLEIAQAHRLLLILDRLGLF